MSSVRSLRSQRGFTLVELLVAVLIIGLLSAGAVIAEGLVARVSIAGSSLTSDEFCTRLLSGHRVSAVPGIGYGRSCDRFIRVGVGTESMERMKRGVTLIAQLIEETASDGGADAEAHALALAARA